MESIDVLVVDDELASSICRNMSSDLKDKVKDKDINFYQAGDGDEAIKKTQERKFDLVVLDYNMPGKNGYETARAIRDLGIDVELAGFSSNWREAEAKEVNLAVYSMSQGPIVRYISEKLVKKPQKDTGEERE